MDRLALIEDKTRLWKECEDVYERMIGTPVNLESVAQIYSRVDHWLLSQQIQKERAGTADGSAEKQGKPATQKQLAFIIDLGGDPRWTGTSLEASKEIERLKQK